MGVTCRAGPAALRCALGNPSAAWAGPRCGAQGDSARCAGRQKTPSWNGDGFRRDVWDYLFCIRLWARFYGVFPPQVLVLLARPAEFTWGKSAWRLSLGQCVTLNLSWPIVPGNTPTVWAYSHPGCTAVVCVVHQSCSPRRERNSRLDFSQRQDQVWAA